MKIATKNEMENNTEMLLKLIDLGEDVGTWSVQQDDHSDDLFCGTLEEATEAAKEYYRDGMDIVCIAKMGLTNINGSLCADFCFKSISIGDLYSSEEEFAADTKQHDENQ